MNTAGFRLLQLKDVSLRANVEIPDGGKLPFSLNCIINKISESSCTAQFYFEAELNSMMKIMVQKPLENFLNVLAVKLKDVA